MMKLLLIVKGFATMRIRSWAMNVHRMCIGLITIDRRLNNDEVVACQRLLMIHLKPMFVLTKNDDFLFIFKPFDNRLSVV